ncbi:MAG: peptidylprolyl isomerase [Nanoarchaeota archaeon]
MITQDGSKVTVEYTGKLSDGSVFDSSKGREPLTFTIGKHEVISGFENGAKGMTIGDTRTIEIPPDEGYGQKEDHLVIQVPKTAVAQGNDLQPGMEFQTTAPNGAVLRGSVTEVLDEQVILDFNHPLAGKTLFFEVKVLEIKE